MVGRVTVVMAFLKYRFCLVLFGSACKIEILNA